MRSFDNTTLKSKLNPELDEEEELLNPELDEAAEWRRRAGRVRHTRPGDDEELLSPELLNSSCGVEGTAWACAPHAARRGREAVEPRA